MKGGIQLEINDLMFMITPTIKGVLRDADKLHQHLLFMRHHDWIAWYNIACIFTIYPNASKVNHLEEWKKDCKSIKIKRGQKAIPIMNPLIDEAVVWQEDLLYDITQLKLPEGYTAHTKEQITLNKSEIDLMIEKYTVGYDPSMKQFFSNCLYFTFGDCIQFNLESRLQLDVKLPEAVADEVRIYCELQTLIHLIQSKKEVNKDINGILNDVNVLNDIDYEIDNDVIGIQKIIMICKAKLLKKKKKEEDNDEIFKEPMNPNQYPVYRGGKDL